MASGAEILFAATTLATARQSLANAQAVFDGQEELVQGLIVPERQALDAAQLAYAVAQDAARSSTPGWQVAVDSLNAAAVAEANAVAALMALTFDGT